MPDMTAATVAVMTTLVNLFHPRLESRAGASTRSP